MGSVSGSGTLPLFSAAPRSLRNFYERSWFSETEHILSPEHSLLRRPRSQQVGLKQFPSAKGRSGGSMNVCVGWQEFGLDKLTPCFSYHYSHQRISPIPYGEITLLSLKSCVSGYKRQAEKTEHERDNRRENAGSYYSLSTARTPSTTSEPRLGPSQLAERKK